MRADVRTTPWSVHMSFVEGTVTVLVSFGFVKDTHTTFPTCASVLAVSTRTIVLKYFHGAITFRYYRTKGDIMPRTERRVRGSGVSAPTAAPGRPVTVSIDQIKILSDPSRLRILTLLLERDMSISGVVKALGLSPATVHHHMNQLLSAGLIEPARSEVRGNLVEKYYRIPATGIDSGAVWDGLGDQDKVNYRLAVLGMLKGLINESIKRIQEKGTVDFEVGRLYFYHVPWRKDTIQQVTEIFEDQKKKLERLEAKAKAQTTRGDEVMVVLTTLPV
jgi:DNA-binding transcriptional ArsR family regulator